MNILAIVQYAAVLVILTLLAPPLGEYLAHVITGQRPALDPALRPDARATSMANNGRDMAGMRSSSPFYNWTAVVATLVGLVPLP